MSPTDLDPCVGAPAPPAADEEILGVCEFGSAANSCDADATGVYPGGEALCVKHAIALYGDE